MRFIVAVKQVPDTFSVSVDEDGNLDRKGVPSVLNPYCETALMTAVGMKGEPTARNHKKSAFLTAF